MENKPTYYSEYLCLDKLLSCQKTISKTNELDSHDETLFIIVHQAHELWFKQMLIEIEGSINLLSASYFSEQQSLKLSRRLNRLHVIQEILIEQLNALATLSPMEFLEFRNALSPASGFQSAQFRLIEIKLGSNKTQTTHNLNNQDKNAISDAQTELSLFSAINQWLERCPFIQTEQFTFWLVYREQMEKMLNEDIKQLQLNDLISNDEKTIRLKDFERLKEHFNLFFHEETYQSLLDNHERRMSFKASQTALFIFLYRNQAALQLPFQILSTLIQIDENLTSWKAKHLQLVKRIIGHKSGTGGSTGAHYLSQGLKQSIFSDLCSLSTFMLPESMLPELPVEMKYQLSSLYEANKAPKET